MQAMTFGTFKLLFKGHALQFSSRANTVRLIHPQFTALAARTVRPDEEVTQTPSFRNGTATMTRYLLTARQERGILDGTAPIETFDEVRGQAGRGKGLPAVSLLQRVQSASRGTEFRSGSTPQEILAPG